MGFWTHRFCKSNFGRDVSVLLGTRAVPNLPMPVWPMPGTGLLEVFSAVPPRCRFGTARRLPSSGGKRAYVSSCPLFIDRYSKGMGRPRTVELDDAVAAAMACFREHGFEATSIRDLELATGLKATSLYNAFGNKAGLFQAVLDRYRIDVVDRRIDEHLRPELGIGGIRSFFVSTYTVEPSPRHGCLVTNSAIEFAAIDAAAQHRVEGGLDRIRDAFAAQLTASVASGELVAHVDIDATADLLLVLYEGMLTLLRAGQETRVDFGRAVDAVLAHLISNHQRKTP